jgi:hypothetical protein
MAANIMIYNPSNKLHAVAINQTIGRLTGTARPDLKRILYSTKDVYNNYIAYNLNQKQYMTELLSNEDGVSSDRMKEIIFDKKLSRDLDRKKLKLEPNYKSDDISNTIKSSYKTLIDKWLTEDSIRAKIFRMIKDHPNGVSQTELREFLKNKTTTINIESNYNEPTKYKDIYSRSTNQITKLTEKANEYLSNKN